jgi:aminoglycoside phosphotransferase (APT) family kinase protein
MSDELRARVAAHLAQAIGEPVAITSLEPLAGGACQDNYKVELTLGGAARRLVLRSDARTSLEASLDRRREARVIGAAVAAGVKTPAARWPAADLVWPGAFAYFLDWVEGEAIGRRVVKSPELAKARETLPEALAAELARIHSVTPANAPDLFRADGVALRPWETGEIADPVAGGLRMLRLMLDALPAPRPALELALAWLTAHAPPKSEVTLVHGDFRVGNFLVGPDGLGAILDWEFAHFGTPAEDLSWISVRDWRFGKVERPIGGLCGRERFYRAYEAASGRRVDRAEVRYWEIFGNVNWAAGSLHQGLRYARGDRDLELVAVARRACEMEYEALRMIERSDG